ncbi:D-alanyl-D-alanine carboxypeptidase/D-alanyl-D-alanine endopeptidase [Celeribacter marinus]|uniref:D-alanyl-D-alanine carboxypeptidase/D-alanyl-D-alanine endopeptidase n=1 Tax=Celeribacter marinus TaxID=1397108 RepID=UPI003F6AFDD2
MYELRSKSVSRRAALGLLLGGVAGAALGQDSAAVSFSSPFPRPRPAGFHKRAIASSEALIAASGLSGQVSFALADAATGEMLEARHPVLRLPPASVAKAVTSIYALETLGAGFTFETRVYATGPVDAGKIQGDLILVGGGDPTLDTDMLAGLAANVRAAGITGVTGRFLIWDGALPRIEQIDDQQTEYAGYNPTITGLNVNYNRVHFEWKRSGADYTVKMDARAERYAPDVRIASMRIAPRDLPVFDWDAGQGRDEWSVARSALGNGGARWLPVRLPALYAGEVFQAVARQNGIALPKAERAGGKPTGNQIATHKSPPLAQMVKEMLLYSTNLTAEVLGLSATLARVGARGAEAVTLKSSAAAMNEWAEARLGMRHLSLVDHSGLGGASHVSTSDMVRLFAARGIEPLIGPLLKSIAMPDATGKKVDPDHPVRVFAKTGTLDFVSTLAGYVTGPDGRRMAFAIFAADLPARARAKAAGDEVPRGAKTFNSSAKKLQKQLLARWGMFYAS